MPDYRTHTPRERILWRFSVALAVALALLFVSTASVKAAWNMYQTFDISAEERAATEAELASLRSEYENMSATLNQFASERGIEVAVRDRFGVVRPGEGEIRIVRQEPEETVQQVKTGNAFTRLFDALFVW